LVFQDECTLRALVPRSSPRARIALRASAWHSFGAGVLGFETGAPGQWRLTVARNAGPTLVTQTGATAGFFDRARFDRLPRGDYDVRLELTTAAGGVAKTQARIVTLDRLSVAAGRRAVAPVVSDGDGDGGDGWETFVGRCEPRTDRYVACRVIYSWYSLDESGRHTCRGWAHARLRADGIRVADRARC
jgi:hypothetical protein